MAGLTKLESLNIRCCNSITDEDMQPLSGYFLTFILIFFDFQFMGHFFLAVCILNLFHAFSGTAKQVETRHIF